MENGTKNRNRILYLYQYLLRNTDSEHTLSATELAKALKEEYSIPVSRNTLSDDLTTLREGGFHIDRYEGHQNRYYYDGQPFDLAELKVLVDAISSSKFITQRKSDELISKLLTLTSGPNAENLRRHIYIAGRAKSDNESGYYIVDSINEAIDTHRKIRFRYTDFDVNKQRYVSNNGDPYTVSPYSLDWDGDYYYVRGFCDERQEMRNFRLDHIAGPPELLYEAGVAQPEGYSPVDYSKQVFRMYDTDEPVQVQLLCHVSVMKYLIDNFGKEVPTQAVDGEYFTADVNVCTSATFYRWVFGFGGKIRIEGPEGVKEEYRNNLKKALDAL